MDFHAGPNLIYMVDQHSQTFAQWYFMKLINQHGLSDKDGCLKLDTNLVTSETCLLIMANILQ